MAVISIEAWTNVSIAGNLGGIIVLTADATGAYADPTLPPFALIYRNGSLWNGVIDITRKAAGEYSFDISFADGIWQLGDHGQINVYWTPDGSAWYCRSYFWLVNRLEYETYQCVTTALPNAAPGAEGGLPTCDGQNRVTTANPASVSNVNIETENTVIQS